MANREHEKMRNPKKNDNIDNIRKVRTAALPMALALSLLLAQVGTVAAQAPFNDISSQPSEIQQAIEYSFQKGYMQGYPDGSFRPADGTTRLDCARALVCVFRHAGESADPSITFTDLPSSDPGFIWANLAVKYGLMDRLPDGSFQPFQAVSFERVALGVTAGKGLNDVAQNVNALTGGNPYYSGAMTVFMDLHLKYRYSKVWPGQAYPRGEMAYTLYRLDNLESWRTWYLRDSFSAARCRLPAASEGQLQAVRYGFERLGCPYVYGGERESEGGFDCSGFVYNTLSIRMGYPMKRVADDQARDERYLYVSREALEPGDAIFFYEEEGGDPSRYIGHAGMYVGNGIFIHSTGSNAGVSFDCLDNNDYWRTHFAWGRRVIGGPYNDRFDTWLVIYNPHPQQQPVEVRYLRPDKTPQARNYVLAPHSRFTIAVDNLFPYDEVSMEVRSPAPGVIAERAMYFNYRDWAEGGHASTGMTQPAPLGYFAEGYTGSGFHTWLLFANPHDEQAKLEVSYLLEGGPPLVQTYNLAPQSRFTVLVNAVPGLPNGSVGISYRSLNGVPVAAERAMYFDYRGKRGGHCTAAVTEPSTRLYLAEGYTGGDFDTWICLANPNSQAAEVEITYLIQGGKNVSEKHTVAGRSRLTIDAENAVAEDSFGVSINSLNGVGIIAERAMYFNYRGRQGGHCSSAVTQPSARQYLAEGYTGGDFDTWICLANPNGDAATARVVFSREDSSEVTLDVYMPAASRVSVHANEVPGLGKCSFSTRVECSQPLFVERSVYFFYKNRSGGTNCSARESPHERTFFAEGYTGG